MIIAQRLSVALLLISLLCAPRPAPAASDTALRQPVQRAAVHRPARQRVALLPAEPTASPSSATLTMTVYLPLVHWAESWPITRVSVASDGTQGNGDSSSPALSADGQVVAFSSYASNLAAGDTNGAGDIFVHNRASGQIMRISVAPDGAQSNSSSYMPALSADGQVVAFISHASNLVAGDTNQCPSGYHCADIFVHERASGQTTRVSVASDGTQSNSWSGWPALSADGQVVAFYSDASNLVAGDTNGQGDIFVHDRASGQTRRVSIASDGTEGNSWSSHPALSADGQVVAFESYANNLVAGDTNQTADIFVYDRASGQTRRVSVASDGTQGSGGSHEPALSADGQLVAFSSGASNLVAGDTNGAGAIFEGDIFVYDRASGQTTRVSVAPDGTRGNGSSYRPALSADGQVVAFSSRASNLVAGNTNRCGGEKYIYPCPDIFVHDRKSGQTRRVSVAPDGTQGDRDSSHPALSADGRLVAFDSEASNLVLSLPHAPAPGDTNNASDIFVVTLPAAP